MAKQQDDLARAALERALSHQRMAEGLAEQHTDQTAEAETLRAAYYAAAAEAHRDAVARRTADHATAAQPRGAEGAMRRRRCSIVERRRESWRGLSAKVDEADSRNHAARTLLAVASSETLDERFATLEQNDQIEALLLELKERQPQLADHS